MRIFLAALITSLSVNAFAIETCEKTVVPLAIEMAKASGQSEVYIRLFVDVSADYRTIVVTLRNHSNTRQAAFQMNMGEEYTRLRKCVVASVEAVAVQ